MIVEIAGAKAFTRLPAATAIFPDRPVMLFFMEDMEALNAVLYLARLLKAVPSPLNNSVMNRSLILDFNILPNPVSPLIRLAVVSSDF